MVFPNFPKFQKVCGWKSFAEISRLVSDLESPEEYCEILYLPL